MLNTSGVNLSHIAFACYYIDETGWVGIWREMLVKLKTNTTPYIHMEVGREID